MGAAGSVGPLRPEENTWRILAHRRKRDEERMMRLVGYMHK